eukprot:7497552-Ditylum_brightwellii.AAC.1
MVKICSTLPSESDTSKDPPFSIIKDTNTKNNPTAKPLAIPATSLSGILPTKPDKTIQNKSENFEIHSSALEDIANSTTFPNKTPTNIFRIPKEFLDFHSKINQEPDEIKDNFDIRLLNIEQQLNTSEMSPNFETKLTALTSSNTEIKSSLQKIRFTTMSNMQTISAIKTKLSKTSSMANHLKQQISKNNKFTNDQLIAVGKKMAEKILVLQISDKQTYNQ